MSYKDTISVSHCGKLGDFIVSLPVVSWIAKSYGKKIVFLLPENFEPFRHVNSLLKLQDFTEDVLLVDHIVENWGYGGQPYKFNHKKYVDSLKSFCFGISGGLNDMIWNIYAREHESVGVDEEFILNLGDIVYSDKIFCNEQLAHEFPEAITVDFSKDILYNYQVCAGAAERHLWSSSIPLAMDWANKKFYLYDDTWVGKLFFKQGEKNNILDVHYRGAPFRRLHI